MRDVMLDDGAENFREIELVRCLVEAVDVLGIEANGSPATIEAATAHDALVTTFLPLAIAPVTGGSLTHVPRERVLDVDMPIEEGVRSSLASGERADGPASVTTGDLETVTDVERLQAAIGTGGADEGSPG